MNPLKIRNTLGWLVVAALFALAVRKELGSESQARSWNGEVLGFVPYDFRFPTVSRFVDNWWSPDLDRIMTPTTIGLGWSINVGRLMRMVGLV